MGKETVKVAIILPVYSGDKLEFFKEAYQSMLNQSHKNTDIHIGVDGPVSPEVSSFLREINLNSRTFVYFFEENKTLPVVLNFLIKKCLDLKYDFLARMDADDISLEYRIEKQLNFLLTNNDIDVVGGAIIKMDHEGTKSKSITKYPVDHNSCLETFVKRSPLAHPSVMFRGSFFTNYGYYDESYKKAQDYALWLRAVKQGCKIGNLPEPILFFRATEEMLRKRRVGSKMMLKLRLKAAHELNLGWKSYFYAYLIFLGTISPIFIKKIGFRLFR